ncbi:PH domain-containing protein [Nakamurella panacisegetis]|uniref:PH domain-containing protein n=1 Tax=Nakamurella panacisegetis TaxID=1090615 RepID=A0A1H0PKG8_9ACTN|nr:PH domain-containing protein [Nakamurella panacisegetis]SDP05597.1 PH domain-containing protein [Nakamurella panacisegetis]
MSNTGKPTTEPLLTVRPRKIAIYAAISSAAVVIVMLVVGILLHDTNDGVSFQMSDQIGLAGLGVLIGIAILMMARPTLKVFPEGLLIRNILGENFYEWALIYEVSFPQGAQWALLRMPDDETHPLMAIQLLDRGRAVEALQKVREFHARYAPPPPAAVIPDEATLQALAEQENNRPLGRLEIIDRVKAAKKNPI